MIKKYLTLILSFSIFYSCTEQAENNAEESNLAIQEKDNSEIIEELFHSIPPPIELSTLLKNSGFLYNVDYLNPIENVSKYDVSYEKAINLGVYGTDIAYIHIYNQPQDAMQYLAVIKEIADDLNIANLFDYAAIQSLLKEENTYDSLINVTTHNFESINTELREQDREHISAMIVTGGWIEGFHILNELYQESNSSTLNEKIAEQKFTLSQILLLLSHFKDQEFLSDLTTKLKKIQEVLEKSVYIEGESNDSTIDVENGWHLSPENCEEVYTLTTELRAFITN